MVSYWQTICLPMEGQIPASQPPEFNERPPISPENLEALKEEARRRAIADAMQARREPQPQMQRPLAQPPMPPQPQMQYQPAPMPEPRVVYVRRNMTIAEMGLTLLISVGILTGVQFAWNFTTDIFSRIEIREK